MSFEMAKCSSISLLFVSVFITLTGPIPVVASEATPPVIHCPEDMVDMEGFCIDRIPVRSRVNWYASSEACEAQGKRLCTNEEWLDACDVAPNNEVEMMPPPNDESEWLHNWVFETSSKVFASVNRGYYRCTTVSHPWPSDRPYAIKWYRCCK